MYSVNLTQLSRFPANPETPELCRFTIHPVKTDSSQRGPIPVNIALPWSCISSNTRRLGTTRPTMAPLIPIRVFLLSDSRFLSEALGHVLRKTPDILMVGASPCSVDAPLEIILSTCDVLLTDSSSVLDLDSRIPEHLRCSLSKLKIVIINADGNESAFSSLARLRVMGFVLKEAAVADAISAIRIVANGDAVYPPQLHMMRYPQMEI